MNYKEGCGEGNDHKFCPWCGQSKKEHWKGGIMEKLFFFCLYFYYWSIPESWRRHIITLGAFSALISDFNFIPQAISNYQTCKALFLSFFLFLFPQAVRLLLWSCWSLVQTWCFIIVIIKAKQITLWSTGAIFWPTKPWSWVCTAALHHQVEVAYMRSTWAGLDNHFA